MKILYSIQATGNGHIARAAEIMPYLTQYGEVDVFLSGSNSNLAVNLPVKYRSKGVSLFYGNHGRLDYKKIYNEFSFLRMCKEARALPVEDYDIILNDFESITALACKIKNVPSVNFGHQASFYSKNTPLSETRDWLGETILRHYAKATAYVGLHFEPYDDFIFNPIIKQDILSAEPSDKGHITVYLSHYSDEMVAAQLKNVDGVRFEVFSKKAAAVTVDGNITYMPVSAAAFNQSMIHCHGMITGAGFETPAEILYMGKKLLCLPIRGQYEQWCNAAALKRFNVPVIPVMDDKFATTVKNWLNAPYPHRLQLTHTTYDIVQHAVQTARALKPAGIAAAKKSRVVKEFA
ncbi:MAG TPA: glycosyltransferase family protein [Chitinophagaceae bacterium]|nr:glycosyltransferase family protein [Chitinophagaceae bacterium]